MSYTHSTRWCVITLRKLDAGVLKDTATRPGEFPGLAQIRVRIGRWLFLPPLCVMCVLHCNQAVRLHRHENFCGECVSKATAIRHNEHRVCDQRPQTACMYEYVCWVHPTSIGKENISAKTFCLVSGDRGTLTGTASVCGSCVVPGRS